MARKSNEHRKHKKDKGEKIWKRELKSVKKERQFVCLNEMIKWREEC